MTKKYVLEYRQSPKDENVIQYMLIDMDEKVVHGASVKSDAKPMEVLYMIKTTLEGTAL